MTLAEGSVLYVRIDSKAGTMQESEQDAMDSMAYLEKIARERYLVAGVFGDMETEAIDGAMILYEAKDLQEARQIANDDPISQRGFYRCQVYRWNVMLLSQQTENQ